MDPQQWQQQYASDSTTGASRRHNGTAQHQQPMSRDYASPQHQPGTAPAGYKYDQQYHPSASTASSTASPISGSQLRDGNGDIPMHDAHDAHAGIKYPMRPHHQSHPSGGRPANLHSPQEPSAAAHRYSPMDTLSPSSPYAPKPPQYATAPTHRQSPSKQGDYPQSSYYAGRQQGQQVPPMSPYSSTQDGYPSSLVANFDNQFGSADPKSPRRSMPLVAQSRGPVPEFKKIRGTAELRPKKSQQPPFRRANPEGGFISPLQALTSHLPATYRICNPEFKYETSRNPRRVLTKPSKGVKNDGYDNEDSDYILYVNDILGSEEAGHKNRYLILDVLGQGTFGQVVKCQNLKTQEVVAVKVIKNRTAYFNQSMMEVSVLDLLNTKLDKNDDHHLLRLKDPS
jgi:dual specificity protein kinase YAK1